MRHTNMTGGENCFEDMVPDFPAVNPRIVVFEKNQKGKKVYRIFYTASDKDFLSLSVTNPNLRKVFEVSATRNSGTVITDEDVILHMKNLGVNFDDNDWAYCELGLIGSCIVEVLNGKNVKNRKKFDFGLRPEQTAAIVKTVDYFRNYRPVNNRPPRFLWNCKMRFGKTFTTYSLAKRMGWKRILILTFMPVVQNSWEEDLLNHVDFEDWQFIKRNGMTFEEADENRPIVCFGSFQDYLGRDRKTGNIKAKNRRVHEEEWDLVVFDEYHFGAWREKAKELFGTTKDSKNFGEEFLPITAKHYLYLSGTPFRALNEGEFREDQIYSWTYIDEQNAKKNWSGNGKNPYASLPGLRILTYNMSEEIVKKFSSEENSFDLNLLFRARRKGSKAFFVHEKEVRDFLLMISGRLPGAFADTFPFSGEKAVNFLSHTIWYLPNVASCYAMKNLLEEDPFFSQYRVIVAAGDEAGVGAEALPPVLGAMGNPLQTKTITLSCGKLLTGITVRSWTGILMLRNCESPEAYFQAAFRVQNPWVIKDSRGEDLILKHTCFVFDFSPERTLKQTIKYLGISLSNKKEMEKIASEFLEVLSITVVNGSSMKPVNFESLMNFYSNNLVKDVFERGWKSFTLVNINREVIDKLKEDEELYNKIMGIDCKSTHPKEMKIVLNSNGISKKSKKKDKKSKKGGKPESGNDESFFQKKYVKELQQKASEALRKIPVLVYLMNENMTNINDIINHADEELFSTITKFSREDFRKMVNIGFFNVDRVNDMIAGTLETMIEGLEYTGIVKHGL